MKKIKVLVNPQGKVSIEALGYQGSACSLATARFTEALGQIQAEEKKEEYYQQDSNLLKE